MRGLNSNLRARVEKPWLVGATVLAAYGLLTAAVVVRHDVREFIHVGSRFARQSTASAEISAAARFPGVTEIGYDGQFAYYIAVDPLNARFYLDDPPYRYARIGYPLAARALALGRPSLIPYTMLLINLAAVAGGSWAIAAALARSGHLPWLALVYGFFPGLVNAYLNDVNEPMAYALAAAGVLALGAGGLGALVAGAALFGLAGLTRDQAALFPIAYIGAALASRLRSNLRLQRAAVLFGLGVLPIALFRLWLATWPVAATQHPELASAPFGGLLSIRPFLPAQYLEVLGLVLPGLACVVAASFALWRRRLDGAVLALVLNALVSDVFLQRSSWFGYFDAGRISTGVVLAALLAVPAIAAAGLRPRRWLAPAAVLWFTVVPLGLAAPHTFHVFKF